jgi:hypothetical protein
MTKDLERTLYRIISGRTAIFVGGSSFCVVEPNSELIAESYDKYDIYLEDAYASGCLVEEEFNQFLFENDVWSKAHDAVLKQKRDELENLKVLAYENHFREKDLKRIKREIRGQERSINKILVDKSKYDFIKCDYVAEMARLNWLLSKTTYLDDNLIDEHHDIAQISNAYFDKAIDSLKIRDVAKCDTWRSMWFNNKLHGGQLFKRAPMDYSRDQITLCSYTSMYDNVYEHYERPDDIVIDDHDCLDGWFIVQKRNSDSARKKNKVISKNPKIANAKEQFVFANNQDEANVIYNMNDSFTRSTLQQRFESIQGKEKVKDIDFADVQQDLMIQQNNMAMKKGRR